MVTSRAAQGLSPRAVAPRSGRALGCRAGTLSNMDLQQGIASSYLGQGLSPQEIDLIVGIAEVVHFSDRQVVVEEFADAVEVFLLLQGRLRVTTGDGDPIARLEPGAIVGELALFERMPRSATVVSDGDASLLRLTAEAFNALMDQHPAIGVKVLRNIGRTLSGRLRSSNLQLEAVLGSL